MHHRKNHHLLMLLGCGLMLIAVFLLLSGLGSAVNREASGALGLSGAWAGLLFLLCPLMHLLMLQGHKQEEYPRKDKPPDN
ncbi:Protein of unknown function [Thermanaeromonas toyohensis ToBE]|uniref:DUF2933 domain-containing protein n=1 Tax=Thermanaeromonas toyohensis ToBE TaxID=698762 RepID=A0A1W1W2P3_9FIRM|nr:DUF2933 domain-containing protein [Thermanaeromonas toyohensis]SMB99889.1 Protein of unknown function [Thermanaeromonas toyohensis ToBE]